MITLKCKICGGDLVIEEGSHICECEYCGTKQTLPSVDNDVRANAFNRANHFRMQKEFDKAIATYERLLNDDDTDAEAHWGAALSRYGIEYVEDPTTHERIPTCHRLQITSILADADCKAAIENAPDAATRALYEKEAHRIADIQKGILAISANEKPYDIFICYKEADASGRRTPDSAIAQDIYYQLVQEGYRVFFSRITLEDKLGREYEPYIFAALNSARVMLVIGTKPEHFNAVWVKNEWSRYLELMRQDRSRLLIPCYKGMDAYDIPDELSMLQSQDMGRVGFIPDLVRNIKKIIVNDEPKQVTPKAPPAPGGDNVSALLKRISIFLGDGDWAKADEYCERVLDMDPECAEAYLGKLMVEKKVTKIDGLKDCREPFDSSDNFKKIERFGNDSLLDKLNGYLDYIDDRNEQQRLTGLYNAAVKAMKKAGTEQACKDAAQLFQNILDFKDSAALSKECLEKAEFCRKDAIYDSAKNRMTGEDIDAYEAAIKLFQDIPLFKDVDEQIQICQKSIEDIKAKQKKRKIVFSSVAIAICICIATSFFVTKEIIPNNKYKEAITLMNDGKYKEAAYVFEAISGYKDSNNKAVSCYKNILNDVSVGENILFGFYEQDGNTSNGKEYIEWQVLEKKDDRILIISKSALDCRKYNDNKEDVTWATCSLRAWLNKEFVNDAFSINEQSIILSSQISPDKNPCFVIDPGTETIDKVFLLNISETRRYFGSDELRMCVPTKYAKEHGAYTDDKHFINKEFTCWWWLRTPGVNQSYATRVDSTGEIIPRGNEVNKGYGCVRPAMWVSIE